VTAIAEGLMFSRHASESPGVIALSQTNLMAYWSQRPSDQKAPPEEVDVCFAISTNRGENWTTPALANRAGTGVENSYPSATSVDADPAELIWLDGSNWKQQKRVTLMSRTVQTDGAVTGATVIDPDTCTCCPTTLVQTNNGLLAAYRGHTPENIRDIEVAKNLAGHWSEPYIPQPDHWHFAGCPVNGPHLAADGSAIALIWFSVPREPEVKLAFSNDGGSHFTAPLRVDEGNALGRAQVVLLPESTLAFWIENKSGVARLMGRSVQNNATLDAPFEVAHGDGPGYPHAARAGNGAFITWADESPTSQIHIAVLEYKPV
jgi:hypothetical protein